MLISCNKLKSHIKNPNDIDWEKIWSTFTIRTAEVENVIKVGNTFDSVVIAEIKECVNHPDSDHLHVLKVDCGESEWVQVVCGAPNVRVGLKTAYVKVGGHIDGMEIKSRPLRGILSNGMCCSGRELKMSDNHDGILELPEYFPVGKDIKECLPIDDIIVEIDNKSLTNRPDLWGHYGIAREICAITNHELLPLEIEEIKNDKKDLDIVIKEKDLCNRYCGLKIENIKNNQTPLEMQIFLHYIGMRSISLIVDLTNYLMVELGQPMHAFDSRIVKNIEVGLANASDTFKTLDGTERTLTSEMLMIKNENEYFGIAGVMGGLDSEILEDTTGVFLESANFHAGNIRRTAAKLGLRTEASARYEKSLDPNMTDFAIKRFVYLLRKENENMQIASNLTDIYPKKPIIEPIHLDKKTLNIYMGKELEENIVTNILKKLEFDVKTTEESYIVTPPSFRATKDIKIKQDVIEEIARIYGLENFTPKPLKLDLTPVEHETTFNQEYEVKHLLATKFDGSEVHSYIWYDTNLLNTLGIQKDNVKLLGKETNHILRDDLSLSLLNIVKENFKNINQLKIFEIGTIIKENKNHRILSIILADDEKKLENIYQEAKKIVKYLFQMIKNIEITLEKNPSPKEYYHDSLSNIIKVKEKEIGSINVLNKTYTNKLSKKKCIVTVDINFDDFVTITKENKYSKEISKYPSVELDYTIIAKKDTKYREIEIILDHFKKSIIQERKLVGTYEDESEKKFTIRYIVGSQERTLNSKELNKLKENFISYIRSNHLEIIE